MRVQTMTGRRRTIAGLSLGLLSMVACAGDADDASSDSQTPVTPIQLGSSGPQVRALHEYLTRYGYFENPALRRQHKNWQPIVNQSPANLDVFDRVTEEGLREFQKLMGIEQTGIVDQATSELMAKPRCAHPDFDPDRMDPTQKFAIATDTWGSTRALKYKFLNYTSDMIAPDIRATVQNAFDRWAAVSDLTFTRVLDQIASHIELRWRTPSFCGTPFEEQLCDYLALAHFPDDGGDITFNDSETWNWNFLQTVATHEIGHTLGLHHSSFSTAIMYPIVQSGPIQMTIDDMQAVGAVYSSWGVMAAPVGIQDFSYSQDGSGSAWAISTTVAPDFGNFIYSRSASGTWTMDNGAASLKVAAVSSSVVWTVDKYGNVWERLGPSNYITRNLPVPAVDITYGGGTIWAVGNNNQIYLRSGNIWQVLLAGGGTGLPLAGTKVAVGPVAGYPCYGNAVWVVKPNGRIIRRRTASCTISSFVWEDMPFLPSTNPGLVQVEGGPAKDIAVGADGSVWAIGGASVNGGNQIYIWNQQDSANLGTGVPSRFDWRLVSGGAVGVAVQPDGTPWVNNNANTLFRRNRQ
jgi:peptidoglycan hydrolase-like protein with peptidoglycan-binding domain